MSLHLLSFRTRQAFPVYCNKKLVTSSCLVNSHSNLTSSSPYSLNSPLDLFATLLEQHFFNL